MRKLEILARLIVKAETSVASIPDRELEEFIGKLTLTEEKRNQILTEWRATFNERDIQTLIKLYAYLKSTYPHMADPELVQVTEEFVNVGRYPLTARKITASVEGTIQVSLKSGDVKKDMVMPVSEEEMEKILTELGASVEITYADAPFYVNKNTDPRELNRALNSLKEVSPEALPVMGAMIKDGLTLSTALDIIVNNQYEIVRDVEDEESLGFNLIKSNYFPDTIINNYFIDYQGAGEYAVSEGWSISETNKIAYRLKK